MEIIQKADSWARYFVAGAPPGRAIPVLCTGHKGSGRTTVVNRLLEQEDRKSRVVERNFLYVAQLGSDATAQNAVSGDESVPRVIVIEDADELLVRQRQTLLYSFLGLDPSQPVACDSDGQQTGLRELFGETREISASTARIIFTAPLKFADYYEAFKTFLGCEAEICDDWVVFIASFVKDRAVLRDLRYMFEISSSYGVLKSCVAVFLGWLTSDEKRPANAVSLWESSVRTLCPSISPVVSLLNHVSLRTFCVFLCVLRRLEKCPPSATVSYAKVVVDYKHLCHTADSRMHVADDSVVHKELDLLVRMKILFADTKANNTSFRRVSLHADSFILADAVKSRMIPSTISEWFKTIPAN